MSQSNFFSLASSPAAKASSLSALFWPAAGCTGGAADRDQSRVKRVVARAAQTASNVNAHTKRVMRKWRTAMHRPRFPLGIDDLWQRALNTIRKWDHSVGDGALARIKAGRLRAKADPRTLEARAISWK